ncbi:MAG: hypothetical protein ACKPKO_01800, partial [Candidatus Fonsibacter sp.]
VLSKWVDEATLPCMAWAFSIRFYEPRQVIHECVKQFQAETLAGTFEVIDPHKALPKSPLAYSTRLGVPYAGYSFFSFVFGPKDLGIPSQRMRRYTGFNLNNAIYFAASSERNKLNKLFKPIAFRKCTTYGSIYMVTRTYDKHAYER